MPANAPTSDLVHRPAQLARQLHRHLARHVEVGGAQRVRLARERGLHVLARDPLPSALRRHAREVVRARTADEAARRLHVVVVHQNELRAHARDVAHVVQKRPAQLGLERTHRAALRLPLEIRDLRAALEELPLVSPAEAVDPHAHGKSGRLEMLDLGGELAEYLLPPRLLLEEVRDGQQHDVHARRLRVGHVRRAVRIGEILRPHL